MSKNAFIDLIAKLDRTKSKDQIITDLGVISTELNKLKDNGLNIQCHIDTSSEAVNRLQGELNTLASKLKLNIGVDAKSVAKTQDVANASSKLTVGDSSTKIPDRTITSKVQIETTTVKNQIQEIQKMLQENVANDLRRTFDADAIFFDLISGMEKAGNGAKVWTEWVRNGKDELKDFSVYVQEATGDVQRFHYAVNKDKKTGDFLGVSLTSIIGSDKGSLQQQEKTLKFIDEYTSKINSLRNTSNPNLTASLNGETISFKSLLDDLEKLRNGQGSIEDVRTKFVALQSAIKDIDSLLGEKQGKGYNRFKNANITAKEFDNTLKTVRVDLDNLKGYSYNGKADNIPQVSELNKEYKSLQKTINELNSVEESQRGNKWYEDFANASEKVRQLQSDIKLLNKLKKDDTSSGTKKQYEELSKIINAYREMQKLEKRRYADKTGENEINKINSLEGGYRRIINTTQERLKNTGLLTSEIKKLIDAEEKAFNKSVNYAKAQQQDRQARIKAATDEKQANDNRSRYMSEITNAYSRMNAEYSKLYNPKLSQDERNLAQQRIDWNDKIIKHNRELLDTENLLTQKNKDKLNQLKEINQQKEKEAQASANRVTTAQAETQRLSQEKKEAKDLATTVTQIVNGYEKLATLYSGKTALTNGTAKSDINKAESARQHSELQAQLSELTEIANANDKITKQQQEQIANAKTQYEQSVKRTNQYNQQIINEQNQIQADRESTELAKQQRKVRQDILGDIKSAYDQMNKLNGIISNSKTGEKERQDAEKQYAIAKQTAVSKEEELRLYALSCEYSSRLTQEEEKKLQKYKELNQNQESLNENHRVDIQQSQLDNAKYEEKKRLIKEITDLYSKSMIKTNQTLFNSSPDSESYQTAKNRLSIEEAQLKTKIELLNKNHELTGQEESQIISAREKYQLELKGLTAKANDTKATREQKAVADEIVQTYREMASLYGKVNNPNKPESARKEALYQLEEKQSLVDALSVSQQFTAEQEKQIQKAKQGYQNYQRLKDKEDEGLNVERLRTKEYNNLVQKVKQYTDILSKFNNSRQVKQNTGFAIGDDPNKRITVSQQIKDNEILLQQLNDISNILSQGKDPKVLKDAQKELNKIIGELDVAKKNSQEFTNTLTNNKIARDAERNLNTIRNQINKFGNFNPKAIRSTQSFSDTSTYADEYRRIQEMANDASLKGNADRVNELTTAFKNFEQRARAAGLTSNKFFVDMGSQLKMVLNRYISLYAVIGYIRKMVDNVKALDEAMINLRRVTNETESGYVAFLEKANKQASELKVTTSELVQQTYQWSKLGYELDDALTLSKASTIFSKVADITEEQSLKNLITILKAYGIEAKNVMDVVDKLDNINNKYAVDAAGLGDGLERSASALAMTGNSLEQSIAMLTGAGEITQNLENTGNAMKVVSLRLQNMKGKLEELEEPVDDLMEVSKVQTQILNLTHNQVDIFDKTTKEFRSTYDIIKDIANIWDSLNSTSRASLTEILFGKNRANIGLALIQSFQSGQTQNALKDVTHSMGVATNEYNKMMEGIEAHSNALKGAVEQLSNTVLKKNTVNGFIDFAKGVVDFLTLIIRYTKGWGVALGVVFAYMSGKQQIWITGVFKGIAEWLGIIKTETEGASKALIGFKTLVQSISSLGIGLLIGLGISVLSKFVDGLITTTEELDEMRAKTHDTLVDLKQNADELDETSNKLDNVAKSYTKVSTTVTNVTERKQQLQELQNELVTSYQDEAEGIDLVNGKYSEQLKKLDEIKKQEEENFEIENAGRIARARAISNMNISESDLTYDTQRSGYTYGSLTDAQREIFEFDTPTLPWKISDKDKNSINEIVNKIDGMYKGIGGAYYLTGDINQARDAMSQFIDQYSRLRGYNQEVLDLAIEHYNMLKEEAQIVKDMQPYLNEPSKPTNDNSMIGQLYNLRENVGNDILDAYWKPFNDKLDEAHDKLQQLANPDDLSIFEYDTIWHEAQELEHTLYDMAGSSESAKNKVSDLFNQFKIGINENGDGLDKFTENFKTALNEEFKTTSEIVTTVQDAIEKLGEGKGISHTDAWKLLEEDTEGYLQTIKLVNGEYVFSEEELIRFKDAKIKNTIEEISLDRKQYEQKIKTLQVDLENYQIELKHQQEILNMKAKQGMATQADLAEMQKIKINISETKDEIKKFGNLWKRNNILVEELNQNLGATRTISVGMETDLNNAVKALENEVKAVDDTIDSLNNRKDALESEKKELQEQLDILNEQKKVIEEQQKSFQKAVTDYMKRYEDSLKSQLDSLKQQQDDIKDEYEERIKVLKDENEERDLAYKKEKALLDLNKAKQQQVRTYSSARGWEYGASKEKVVEAQKNLDDVLNEEQIKALEKERDEKIKPLEKQEKALDHQIKAYEEYVKQYDILTEEIENKDGELLAEQLLGSDWREKIEKKDEGLLRAYKQEYENFTVRLEQLTKVEIKNIEASIKAKENEIDKIGDEITAYNNYKTAVQSNLNDAKSALENYKNSMDSAKNDVISAASDMEHGVWENLSKIQQWMNDTENNIFNNKNKAVQWLTEWADAYESMQKRLANSSTGYGIVNSAWDAKLARGYADGGVNSTTGIAMLHGTKQKSETIFNANDSKKLYEAVHETPSVMASIIKQAVQLSGFNPSNIVNNNGANTNSVNVNIGQVVANNPQDFVRNLDPHLDAYFKRKLTQSYTQ